MASPSSSSNYAQDLTTLIGAYDWSKVDALADALFECWKNKRQVFLCGNGGSAANATHLANDFLYGINPGGRGLRVLSLTDNASILTCLGNDTGYENIFATQLETHSQADDLIIVFSGSGNSPNVVAALETAQKLDLQTAAVLGYEGGKCKNLVDHCIHFPIQDMQISEDMQQIVGHMLTRRIKELISQNG